MKNIKHLKCLSVVKSMKAINQLTPAAYPGNHCPMHTSLAIASRIKGVSTLVIGSAECAYYSRNVPGSSPYKEDALHWTYTLDENEVVFGCREKIIQAVKEMDQKGAEVILLISTCVPEVIGEDMESIIFEVEKTVHAKVLSVALGNFKCGSHQPGFWQTLLAMGKLIEQVPSKQHMINILGRSAKEEHIPMPQIIKVLETEGYTMRFIAPDSTIEDFKSAGDAQINIVLSPYMNPLADYMQKEHHIPYFTLHEIYAAKEIKALYTEIFKALGKAINEEIWVHYEETKSLEKKVAERVKGLSYIGAKVGALQPLPLHVYLTTLGLSPIMLHIEDYYPSDTFWRKSLLERGENPITCMMVNEKADKEYILELAPDRVIGDWAGRRNPNHQTIQVFDLYGHMGFERTINLLKRFLNEK